jgi:hypothetical protein
MQFFRAHHLIAYATLWFVIHSLSSFTLDALSIERESIGPT